MSIENDFDPDATQPMLSVEDELDEFDTQECSAIQAKDVRFSIDELELFRGNNKTLSSSFTLFLLICDLYPNQSKHYLNNASLHLAIEVFNTCLKSDLILLPSFIDLIRNNAIHRVKFVQEFLSIYIKYYEYYKSLEDETDINIELALLIKKVNKSIISKSNKDFKDKI